MVWRGAMGMLAAWVTSSTACSFRRDSESLIEHGKYSPRIFLLLLTCSQGLNAHARSLAVGSTSTRTRSPESYGDSVRRKSDCRSHR